MNRVVKVTTTFLSVPLPKDISKERLKDFLEAFKDGLIRVLKSPHTCHQKIPLFWGVISSKYVLRWMVFVPDFSHC